MSFGYGLELGFGDAEPVGVLNEQAPGDLLEDAWRLGRKYLDEAQILLRGEALQSLGSERWSDDSLDEEPCNLFCGGCVDLAVDADDATKGRDGIGLEGAEVSLDDGRAG